MRNDGAGAERGLVYLGHGTAALVSIIKQNTINFRRP